MPAVNKKQTSKPRRNPAHTRRAAPSPAFRPPAGVAAGRQQTDRGMAARFGIDEANLARRREFVRLAEDDRGLLAGLVEWVERRAPAMAAAFYDWQFAFPPTRTFFEQAAAARHLSLGALREQLESTQAGYLVQAFRGAEQNWGISYFEDRLVVGSVHDRINLPFKWYIGSYAELLRLLRVHLRRDFKNAAFAARVEEAAGKVFNYDMQAIGDSFLLNTLESLGLSVAAIAETGGGDKTEGLSQVKAAIRVLIEQCTALAEGRLNDAVFAQSAPCAGKFGEAFAAFTATSRRA